MGESGTEEIVFTVMYAITILVALVGNTLLIYIVWKKPEVRSLTSFMFVNMAAADLMVTLVMMPWSIAHRFTDGIWLIKGTLGEITCRGIFFMAQVTVMASILCLAFMAIDRYYAVVCPLNRRSLWFRKARFVTPLVWIMSIAAMSILLVVSDHVDDPVSECGYNFQILGDEKRAIRGVFFYVFIISYLIPLAVISMLYTKVIYKIWFHQVPGNPLIQNQRQQEETKRRVVRMLIIIGIAFAVCWLPAQAYHLFVAITAWEIDVPPLVMYLVYWLGHANSAINPWLYISMSSKIKSAFTRMVSRKYSGESTSSTQKTKSTMTIRNKDMAETLL